MRLPGNMSDSCTEAPDHHSSGNLPAFTGELLVKSWRLLRTIAEFVIPCCGCETHTTHFVQPAGSTITGTFIGHRNGGVKFCVQEDSRSSPLLYLKLPLKMINLANEMENGTTRIVLECDRKSAGNEGPLYGMPVWVMYCNGRKVGFATRRQMTEEETALFELMQTVSTGAGALPEKKNSDAGQLFYWRANFERVVGSADCESFHLSNPPGSTGHEFSVFLLRPYIRKS